MAKTSRRAKQNEYACGRLPQKEDVIMDGITWQVFKIQKGLYKLMNAYLDMREQLMIVRVAMMGLELNITTDSIFCQFWYDDLPDSQPTVVKASEFIFMWERSEF